MKNIPILMYHCIGPRDGNNPLGYLSFTEDEFDLHMKYLHKSKYRAVTLPELWEMAGDVETLKTNKIVVITFDDGYADNGSRARFILEKYGMKATVFVNPEFVRHDKHRVGTDAEEARRWGYLTAGELNALANEGVFDIQSHTMSHDHIFISDKIIDTYSPEKFMKYYWLAWNLFPDEKPDWYAHMESLRFKIPKGYPIFENGRALSAKKFNPDEGFITSVIDKANGGMPVDRLNRIQENKGTFETDVAYKRRVRYELEESGSQIKKITGKQSEFICFPGGAYNDLCLSIAKETGYKAYMASSRAIINNNIEALAEKGSGVLVGLKRISITKDYPSLFKNSLTDYWSCKLKVEMFQGGNAKHLFQMMRKLRNLVRA